MKWQIMTTARRGLEKSPAFGPIEIAGLIALATYFLETDQKWKHQGLWPKTLIHNQAPGVVALLIYRVIQRLCSIPAIAFFEQEQLASTLCGSGISAPAVPQRSAPASSEKPSGPDGGRLLPHENEVLKNYLRFSCEMFRPLAGMNQRATGHYAWAVTVRRVFQPQGNLLRFIPNPIRTMRLGNYYFKAKYENIQMC